jgi:hypothetical protein
MERPGGRQPGAKPPALTVQALKELLYAAGLVDANGMPMPEPTRDHGSQSRPGAGNAGASLAALGAVQ